MESVILSSPLLLISYGIALFLCIFDLIKHSSGYVFPKLGGITVNILKVIKRRITPFVLTLVFLFLFVGCTTPLQTEQMEPVPITLVDGDFTASERSVRVERGGDAVFMLTFPDGLVFGGCDYGNYSTDTQDGVTSLTLRAVRYPCRVHIWTLALESSIFYYLNGGKFKTEALDGDFYLEGYDLTHHLRANTAIGTDKIERVGYVQTSWNTKADGSGERIGLGSRVTIQNGENIQLYAEWKKCIDERELSYTVEDGQITLNAYLGGTQVEEFVLPATIQGMQVTRIAEGFAENIVGKSLVLPHGLKEVATSAFKRCAFEEITFFDGLEEVTDRSFTHTSFKTWHINAEQKPVYQKDNDNAVFADKMDRLILNKESKKMVFFAGCSMSYGLRSERVEKAFDGKYVICNMGVIGGINAAFQLDCITPFLGEGDVFVHAPEVGSGYQLMSDLNGGSRVFVTVEGNYDLLCYTDMSKMIGAFSHFRTYNKNRKEMSTGGYADYNDHYNEYGDIIIPRPYTGENKQFSELGYYYEPQFVTKESMAVLAEKYDAIERRGGKVLFSFSPINLDGLTEEMRSQKSWLQFETAVKDELTSYGYRPISKAEDYLYGGRYFYDADYHLNDEGVDKRTGQLIADIKSVLARMVVAEA